MKNNIAVFLIILVFLPLALIAQDDVLEKYSDNPKVSYESINPKMFQMIAKMGINEDDYEAKAYLDLVKSITSFKTIVTEDSIISEDVYKWVKSRSGELQELMEVKEDDKDVRFYVIYGKDANHVSELLIFVRDMDNVDSSQVETIDKIKKTGMILVSIIGDINLKEIYKLTDKIDIPGGDHLNKL